MRTLLLSLSMLALMLTPRAALAQHSASFPRVSLGLRGVARFGDYALGGLGGQLGIALSPVVHLAFFTDHMVGTRGAALRHEHEVGGMLQFRLLRGARWALFPEVGACASLAVTRVPEVPLNTSTSSGAWETSTQAPVRWSPTTQVEDVQFGVRGGMGAEFSLGESFSVGAEALAITYLGHPVTAWDGELETASGVALSVAGQVTLHGSYAF